MDPRASNPLMLLYHDLKIGQSHGALQPLWWCSYPKLVLDYICILILLIFLFGCQESNHIIERHWQTFDARDDGVTLHRVSLYRALVPTAWIRKDPLKDSSITDTKIPICEFFIGTDTSPIRLTIHTFPIPAGTNQIAPQQHIARWRNQFDQLNPLDVLIGTESHGGFVGLSLDAKGTLEGEMGHVLGWSLALAPDYVKKLSLELKPTDRLTRSDITIKAVGKPHLIERHKKDIIAFATSFELIDELAF